MKPQGRLFVISAPSGTGKTTVVRRLLSLYPELIESVSYTTRLPRAGEVNGVDYHFVDRTTFEKMIVKNYFAEWAHVHGELYGTPAEPIEEWVKKGKRVFLDIDVQGGMTLKKRFPDAVTIFLLPPSQAELVRRLRGRGTEGEEEIQTRLSNANKEMTFKDRYDHCVINDDVDMAAHNIAKIMEIE